jgi:flagellar hook-length control protein FliK
MLPPEAFADGAVQKPGDASGTPGQSGAPRADRAQDRFSALPVSSKPALRTAGVTPEIAETAKLSGETSAMTFAADQTTAAGMTMTDPDAAGFSGRDVSDAAGAPTGTSELRGGARLNAAAPDLPRQIAQHLADAPAAAAGQGIELHLSPEELGPIRLTLRHIDGQMMVAVAVERPETLDLMRRHADQLLQDMRALGYASVRLDMQAQGDRRPPPRPPPADGASPVIASATPSLPEIAQPRRVSGGLDLRF